MTSEIDKLKHFHVENYSGTNFTDDLNDGEEFLYTTIRYKDDKEVTLLCKYVKNKHIGNCPDCVFNKYLCYGLLCNIVVLKVIEAVAVFASHGNSGSSAPWEINLVQRLCDWDIISPLKFTDDEWCQISSDGTCQNRRKGDVFKEPDGSIHYNGAFDKRPISRYNFDTKEQTDNKNPICWHGGNLGLSKKLQKKYTEAIYKYKTNTGKMTASDYSHLFGYLNPYYRSAYNIPKRRK